MPFDEFIELPFRRRSEARMLALQALCVYDAVGDDFGRDLNDFLRDEQVLDDLGIAQPPASAFLRFARHLVTETWLRRPGYDELLARTVAHWSVQRMTPVDRNVLRLGLYELLDAGQPAQVVLNEAIELARRFGDRDSPAFVNGVLDAIRRGRDGDARTPVTQPPAPTQEDGHGSV